jgi:ElaA protein
VSPVDLRWQWAPFAALDGASVYALLALRAEVFVVEQRCAFQDPDGLDPAAWHLLGWDGATLAACLRLLPAGVRYAEPSIGRVVTAPTHRARGLGRVLMLEGLRRAEATLGRVPLALGAQSHLERFYASLGFARTGPDYDEDGIPHVPMRRDPA